MTENTIQDYSEFLFNPKIANLDPEMNYRNPSNYLGLAGFHPSLDCLRDACGLHDNCSQVGPFNLTLKSALARSCKRNNRKVVISLAFEQ